MLDKFWMTGFFFHVIFSVYHGQYNFFYFTFKTLTFCLLATMFVLLKVHFLFGLPLVHVFIYFYCTLFIELICCM